MAEGAIYNNIFARTLCARQQGAGTLTVQLSTANASAAETVTEMYIEKVIWSGNTTIARGANTIFTSATGTAGVLDLYGNGMSNKEYPTRNVAITVADGGSCFVLIGKKTSSNTVY